VSSKERIILYGEIHPDRAIILLFSCCKMQWEVRCKWNKRKLIEFLQHWLALIWKTVQCVYHNISLQRGQWRVKGLTRVTSHPQEKETEPNIVYRFIDDTRWCLSYVTFCWPWHSSRGKATEVGVRGSNRYVSEGPRVWWYFRNWNVVCSWSKVHKNVWISTLHF